VSFRSLHSDSYEPLLTRLVATASERGDGILGARGRQV
jgi:hypothetical protein